MYRMAGKTIVFVQPAHDREDRAGARKTETRSLNLPLCGYIPPLLSRLLSTHRNYEGSWPCDLRLWDSLMTQSSYESALMGCAREIYAVGPWLVGPRRFTSRTRFRNYQERLVLRSAMLKRLCRPPVKPISDEGECPQVSALGQRDRLVGQLGHFLGRQLYSERFRERLARWRPSRWVTGSSLMPDH